MAAKERIERKKGVGMDVMGLCDVVRETAYEIHRYLAHGHLEKIYESALVHRLRKRGIFVEPQHPLIVHDEDGTVLGDYFADMLVDRPH